MASQHEPDFVNFGTGSGQHGSGNAPLADSPAAVPDHDSNRTGALGSSPRSTDGAGNSIPSAMRKGAHRQGTNITIEEPSAGSTSSTLARPHDENGRTQNLPHESEKAGHRGVVGRIEGLRHRAHPRRGQSTTSSNGNSGPLRRASTDHRSFMQRVATGLSEPRPKYDKEPTWRESGIAIAKASWLNVLLVFIPVSWALHFAKVNDTIVFVMSFLAIIPLAKLLGFATEEASLRTGQTIGGLLNATLGNVVELIVAILALVKCELQIVQSSLLGSILSNMLLVLGMCFFAGGLKFSEQSFGDTGAQINSSLLVISVIAILIPAGFHAAFSGSIPSDEEKRDVLSMSRGIAVILLVIYLAYMVFQLWSHAHLFTDTSSSAETVAHRPRKVGKHTMFREAKSTKRANAAAGLGGPPGYPAVGGPNGLEAGETASDGMAQPYEEEEEEEETPSINVWSCVILLLVVAALVGVTAEWLVDSINGLVESGGITEQWVGLILLPIVGNAAEHVTAVTVSYKDKLDLSIGVAVGSSIQIALFVIPVLVLLGWALGKPLSLLFDPFESVTLFLTVLLANYTMQDSRSNWLEGWILMLVYVMIAVAFWFYPNADTPEALLLVCN